MNIKYRRILRVEVKLLILIALILSFGLSTVNLVALNNCKKQILEKVNLEIRLYKVLYSYGILAQTPVYIKVSKVPPSSDWRLIGKAYDGNFFFLDENYVQRELRSFAIHLFIWEIPIIVLTILFTYKTVSFFIEREKEAKELVKTFFLFFTHKLGNFLSLNRVNLEILKMHCPIEKALYRLEKAYDILESDFKKSLSYISSFESEQTNESFRLDELLENLINRYYNLFPSLNLEYSLEALVIKSRKKEVESLLQILIENAFKYADTYVRVSLKYFYSKPIIEIENDVGSGNSGSGIGLRLAKFLARRLGWRLEVMPGKRKFKVQLVIG